MDGWKTTFLLVSLIFMGYVKFPGCIFFCCLGVGSFGPRQKQWSCFAYTIWMVQHILHSHLLSNIIPHFRLGFRFLLAERRPRTIIPCGAAPIKIQVVKTRATQPAPTRSMSGVNPTTKLITSHWLVAS